jgi:hypothetical protein
MESDDAIERLHLLNLRLWKIFKIGTGNVHVQSRTFVLRVCLCAQTPSKRLTTMIMGYNVTSHYRKELCERHHPCKIIGLGEIVLDCEDRKLIKIEDNRL